LQAQGSESCFLVIARLRGRHWSSVITYRQQTICLISIRLISVRRPRLEMTRQSIIKAWVAERLELRRDPAGTAVSESSSS